MSRLLKIARTREDLATLKKDPAPLGFIPTMGALHDGHISLIQASKKSCATTVVSIFVNPTQFGPNEDLSRYPRPLENDLEKLEQENVDIVFLPDETTLYPSGKKKFTQVQVPQLGQYWCGQQRPGHFDGVSSIVARLFNLIQPQFAFFGEKDFQQLAIIQKMTQDLFFPIQIIPCPTIRESDGLALSSRNAYLSKEERTCAPHLYKTLCHIQGLAKTGEKNTTSLLEEGKRFISQENAFKLDYIGIANPHTLEPVKTASRGDRLLIAAFLGTTRLIDNLELI